MNTRDFVVVHHSAIRQDGRAQFGRIDNGHRAREFPKSSLGYYCGYHFVVEENGSVLKARELNERGAHADNCGCSTDLSGVGKGLINFRSIGICLAGDFNSDVPTPEQIMSMHALVWSFQLQGSRFLLHREVKNTNCPAADFHQLFEQEHVRYLETDLQKKVNALKWATGLRRTMLERAISRVLKLLLPTP